MGGNHREETLGQRNSCWRQVEGLYTSKVGDKELDQVSRVIRYLEWGDFSLDGRRPKAGRQTDRMGP